MPDAPDDPLPLEYATPPARPAPRDIARATAISIGMVALMYGVVGMMYLMYVKRGVPLPMEGSWKLYTFGFAALLALCAVAALRFAVAASVAALGLFFAVNMASIVQDPGSIANGAIVKVIGFIILLRATVQGFESRSVADSGR